MFTNRRPTDDEFSGHSDLHDCVRRALPSHVMEVLDPFILDEHKQSMTSRIKNCMVSILELEWHVPKNCPEIECRCQMLLLRCSAQFSDRGMAMNNGLRSCASKLRNYTPSIAPRSVNRGIHSTSVKNMGGGHGHDEPYYLHAKHMYNLDRMTNQKLKMSLGVFAAFSIGVAVPFMQSSSSRRRLLQHNFSC
ncbi:hypothetical protein Sango_2187100 [Sesamum angolense]|uniref:Uncharacterized protein n=1 Tax=Sesamum angolense TaxID=2727404 RepID=A0AAE1WD91_9LAMI|nr:hypothetical protein Sango_2187100 [Sesamum angolense]